MNTQRKRAWKSEEAEGSRSTPATLRLVDSEPSANSQTTPRQGSRITKAEQEELRMRNCNLMLVAIPFMEEMSHKFSATEHALSLSDAGGNLLCSIGRESRTVNGKLIRTTNGSEVALNSDRAKIPSSRKSYAVVEPKLRNRRLAGNVSIGAAIRNLDEVVIGSIHLNISQGHAKPEYREEILQLADIIAIAWIQKIELPVENAVLGAAILW